MRTLRLGATVLVMSTLALGCEHTPKSSGEGSAQPPSSSVGGRAPTPPAPPAPAKTPAPPPASGEAVRPPVAADLADYTKDLQGSGALVATLDTSMGTFHCQLFDDKTPITVASFIGLATGKKPWLDPNTGKVETGKPFFNGLTFHRVIPQFMIQGGDPLGNGRGGPGYQFVDEFVPELRMQPGALAMANAGAGTNGSQFFITEGSPEHLNGKHTIFGQCKEVELVKQIARAPNPPVTIDKVTISRMQSW
jgi:peptidyl-prolyl cis-trans isomerase A (cyclophilin A)